MGFIGGLIIGLLIGGVVTLLVYRNNQAMVSKVADSLNLEIAKLRAKVEESIKKDSN